MITIYNNLNNNALPYIVVKDKKCWVIDSTGEYISEIDLQPHFETLEVFENVPEHIQKIVDGL